MEKDIVSNVFFSDNERYADIINGVGCNGIPAIWSQLMWGAGKKCSKK